MNQARRSNILMSPVSCFLFLLCSESLHKSSRNRPKNLLRAGLDYWFDLDVREYENIEDFWAKNPFNDRHFFATTKTKQVYFESKFEVGDYFYFGREDAGLPQSILDKSAKTCITIPMTNEARSLNIANSVSIVAYEALRQNFKDFK